MKLYGTIDQARDKIAWLQEFAQTGLDYHIVWNDYDFQDGKGYAVMRSDDPFTQTCEIVE